MRFGIFSVALVTAGVASAQQAAQQATQQNLTYIPNTYIVQLEPDSNGLLSPSSHFRKRSGSINYQVRREFSNKQLFYGLSLTTTDGTNQTTLLKTSGVKNVWKVAVVPRPVPLVSAPLSAAAAAAAAANGTLPHITGTSDVNNHLKMSNVDKVHALGIKGKGVKIAIIDSGVDYTHPSLGGGFGPGHKIAFGYDFVGDDFVGYNTPVPDPDPLVTCDTGGHGTHVSGIIGAVDAPNQGFGVLGVAPEATLGMYRVFGCNGGAPDDVIMSAMIQATEDGVDVISMSLGLLISWEAASYYPDLVKSIFDYGTAVIAAAGNDGQKGPWYLSAPALSADAVAVAAIENTVYPAVYTAQTSVNSKLDYLSVFPLNEPTPQTVFWLGTGVSGYPVDHLIANGCNNAAWVAAEGLITDGANTIIMMANDGSCGSGAYSFALSQLNITKILFYIENPDQAALQPEPLTENAYTYVTLEYQSSVQIKKEFAQLPAGKSYTLTFTDNRVHDKQNTAGGAVDYFSSIGPTVEMLQKPQLAAPGGNILSTWPLSGGAYAVLSGTSMATPFAAGAFALVKSARKDLNLTQLISLLQSTASPAKALSSNLLSSTSQQGAGLIDVLSAITADTLISPSQLSLRDSTKPAPQKITIQNKSILPKIYSVSHDAASYIRAYTNYTGGNAAIYLSFTNVHEAKFASASFSTKTFVLAPGQSTTLTVQFTAPAEDRPYSLPIYSGFVQISSDIHTYTIPYLGIPYSRHDANQIELHTIPRLGYDCPEVTTSLDKPAEVNYDKYVFAYRNGSLPPNGKIPLITQYISQPTNFMRMEAVPVDTPFVPDYYGFDPAVKFNTTPPDIPLLDGFLGVQNYGILAQFGIGEVPVDPNAVTAWIQPYILDTFQQWYPLLTYENGTDFFIPSGDFRVLLRALRWGGNSTDPKEYQSWLGPIISGTVLG